MDWYALLYLDPMDWDHFFGGEGKKDEKNNRCSKRFRGVSFDPEKNKEKRRMKTFFPRNPKKKYRDNCWLFDRTQFNQKKNMF